jgi:hypothetical protein
VALCFVGTILKYTLYLTSKLASMHVYRDIKCNKIIPVSRLRTDVLGDKKHYSNSGKTEVFHGCGQMLIAYI